MQAARGFIRLVREFTARVECRHDHFQRGLFREFRVWIHRNAPPIVRDGDEAFGVELDLDPAGMAGDGLVHGIVQHFGEQMVIGALIRAADIHARTFADRFEALEDLDILGGIAGTFCTHLIKQLCLLGGCHMMSPIRAGDSKSIWEHIQ